MKPTRDQLLELHKSLEREYYLRWLYATSKPPKSEPAWHIQNVLAERLEDEIDRVNLLLDGEGQ